MESSWKCNILSWRIDADEESLALPMEKTGKKAYEKPVSVARFIQQRRRPTWRGERLWRWRENWACTARLIENQ